MRLILSRKGFDSRFGGVASPILPDGTLLSLPIPSSQSQLSYNDLNFHGIRFGKIVSDLTKHRITGDDFAHLDPDLNPATYPRLPGWRPIFGQVGAAQRHLERCGVCSGDLFLFFGWFRQTEIVKGSYCYVKNAPDIHIIFGWLQIGEIFRIQHTNPNELTWAKYHPHYQEGVKDYNTLYIAGEKLEINGIQSVLNGADVFKKFHPKLCLTAEGSTRSVWRLPGWFSPSGTRRPLSYHSNMNRWAIDGEYAVLRTVARGQEFVLDVADYPEAISWIREIISLGT